MSGDESDEFSEKCEQYYTFWIKKNKKKFKSNRFLEEIQNQNNVIVFPAFGFKAQLH